MNTLATPHLPKKKKFLRRINTLLTAMFLAMFVTAASAPHLHAQEPSQKAKKMAEKLGRSGVKMEKNEKGQPVFTTRNLESSLTGMTDWDCEVDFDLGDM